MSYTHQEYPKWVGDKIIHSKAEEPVIDRAALIAEAEALGIKVDGRWSDSRLAEEIEKV